MGWVTLGRRWGSEEEGGVGEVEEEAVWNKRGGSEDKMGALEQELD